MKGTFTFTDGESNQTNQPNTFNSEANEINFLFSKDLFRKVKQVFFQGKIIEPRRNTVFIEESKNNVQSNTIPRKNDLVNVAISGMSIKNELYSWHLNNKLNIKQMIFFTYLKQAITSNEQSLSGQFLEQFKTFLSVIVGTATEKNARFGYVKRDFGILSNFGGFKLLSKKIFDLSVLSSCAMVMFLMFFATSITMAKTSSMATLPDVSVKKTINTQSPIIGQDVIYTINVRNDGAIKATGVALTDVLPDGVVFKSASVGGVGFVNSYTTSGVTTVIWNVGEVPATATDLTMTIVVTVVKRGLYFNVAEITSEIETDLDSTPNNHDINEDDQGTVCFSVAEYFYTGDQFKIGLPSGYTNINWTIKIDNGAAFAITSTTPGVSLNSTRDTLTVSNITTYTEFAFTATNKSCPVGGCCPAKFMVGPTGTIGDFVFIDANGNNKQDFGEIGLSGVIVELYDATGTTKLQTTYTDVNGNYIFQGLESGGYRVKFILPSGKTFVIPNVGSSVEDSDAGLGGFSGVIYIDVTKPIGDIGRNNSTIDAGVKVDCNIYPGTLATSNPNVCLPTNGSVVLASSVAIAPTVPAGYSVKYVLTKGAGLVIQQVSNTPTFTVSGTGDYRIHTLVYDANSSSVNFLNLSVVQLGLTTGADVAKIIADNKLCAALDVTGIKFNVSEIPVAPMVAGAIICEGSLVNLGKTSLGTTAKWYTSATATFPFKIDSTISVNPTISTTYYVSVVNSLGCESLRYPVTVTVNPKPQNPIAKSSLTNDCTQNSQTVNLADAITSIPFGSTIEWHVANNIASTIITNSTTVGAGTYYAFAKSSAGCYSFGVSVTVTINYCTCQNPATVSVAPIAAVCGNTSTIIQLSATVGGGATSGIWTSNGTGTFDNATSLSPRYFPSTTDVTKGSVEFTFTTNDPDGADPKCSAASAKNTLTFKSKPLPPTSLRCDQVICLGSSNKLFSVSQGNVVKWYASANSTTPIGIATDEGFVVTPTSEGIYTYYVDATTPEGCVSERSSISFTVKKCLTDLAVIKNVFAPDLLTTPNYLLGQTAVYTIEAQNIGDANATEVKVNDFLPFGATYVNSTPAGEYNSSTGIWTIGNLAKGSSKSLLIQVTIGKTGSIVNTATISGTNEDPTKLANNTSTVVINVVDIADLSLTKTVNKSVVNTGGEVEYTITVLNSGPNTATNVEVKDRLPAGLTFVSSSTLTESAGVLTGTATNIAKGAMATFTFKAKVNSAGKITNVAEISKSDQKDPDSTPGNGLTKPDEDDDDNVDINSTSVCSLDKPTIACGCTQKTICLGGTVTLVATGCAVGSTYVWSNGDVSNSITISPKTNQTYTVYCQKDNCKSESSNAVEVKVIIVDSPLLSASPSKICTGESTILTAKGCAGTIEWQTSPIQTGSQITVTPTISQTYKALCKQFDCISPLATVDVLVTPTPNPPVIVCQKAEICPGETITMTAMNCNGQVKWSTGQETTTITVFPTITTSYTVTCSVNGCTSASSTPYVLAVKAIAVPTIKTSNLVVCPGASATLTAEGCTGNVTWYYGDKTLTGATIIVTPTTTTSYSATCSTIACISDKSSSLTVQVVNPSAPTISSGITSICSGSSVELTATGCAGTVKWSDGQTGAVIIVKPLVSTSYTATCSIGTCISDASTRRNITVTDITKPTISADRFTICVGSSVTLTATGCNGTVKWSDGVTGSSRIVIPSADIKYTATCELTTCKSDVSNELAIKVNNASQVPVISSTKTEICSGESITLSAAGCNGTVKWSDGSTGTTVTLKPTVSTTYSATCTVGTCESPKSNDRTITVNPSVVLKLVASASSAQICVGNEATLTLSGCSGTITWSGGLTGNSIKVKPTETTTYTATCSGVACATDASASVKVTVLPGATTPTITSTNTQICPGAEVILTANNCNGTLLWSNGASTSSITVKPSLTTIYSVKCTVDGCGDGKTSELLTVKVGTPDAPAITSVSSSVCAGGTVVLTATGCTLGTVVWSNGKTGATINETVNSTTTYSAVCKQGTCNSPESNKLTVTVTIPSVPTISCATSTICPGSSVTLYASGCEGTVKWSDGQTGSIITVSPTKTTDYTASCTIGTCTSSASSVATVNVGYPPAPTITCNATSICSGVQITLTATNCTGTIIWSDGQVGNVITAKPNATTTYTTICKLDKCESGKSNPITVTVGAAIKTPTTKNLNNVCPFLTVDLASGVTSNLSAGGVFEYHTGVLPTSPFVSNPNAVGTGTYYVFEKTGTDCYSSPGVINTFINTDCTPKDCAKTPANANAGDDATICAEKVYKLSGTFGGSATSIVWKTTGTGTFDNPLSPTATYRSSLADVLAGTVKLIMVTNDPDGNGPCLAKTDTMVLTMQGIKFKPLVAVTGNLNACGTDSVTLTATAGYAYTWYKVGTTAPIATTRSITVKNSGEYYFKLIDSNKCCSIQSDTASVNYLSIPNAPVANSVKIDQGTTIDLNKLVVSNLPSGATLVFKTGTSSASTMVANPSAVGPGTYYACYKNAQGCYSQSTKITVENKSVGTTIPSEDKPDLTILLTANKQSTDLNDLITFTITVTNNGSTVAKNVVVDNVLPKLLTFQSGDPLQKGDTLRVTTASIPVGNMVTYTYIAKVIKDTIISNTAKITNVSSPTNSILTKYVSTVVLVPSTDTTYADLAVKIVANASTYKVGDNVTYTVTLTNNGAGFAKNVQLCNPIPAGLTYVSGTGIIKAGDSLIIKKDTISKGKTSTFTYTMKANTAGNINNAIKICNSSKADLITPNNTSTSSITVTKDSVIVPTTCKINLAMAILDTAKISNGVYNITYRLIAKNVCKDTLKNVTLFSDLEKTFKTSDTYQIIGKPSAGVKTNLIPNDLFSKTDSSIVKTGSYILPNAIDTIKYVVKLTLSGNKGPFVSNLTIAGKTTGNENLTAKAKVTLRFDLPNTRIGLAKEVANTALKNDSTTYWTVPYRIRVVNMGINAITKLSVKDSLDEMFTAKGAIIIGTPTVIGTPSLTINKKYTGKGLFTDLLVPDSSSLVKGDTAIIDLTVRVNVASAPDVEKIFNNVAVGTGTGTDKMTYKDISTNGTNPDTNGDNDPSNDNLATPVQLKGQVSPQQVLIGLALASLTDTIQLADSTCNVTFIMTAKNYGKDNLRNVQLFTNIQNTIGKESTSWKLVGLPTVIKGNAKVSSTFNGLTDSTITKSDSSFIAVGDSIVIAYMVNIKGALKDTIYTQAIAKAQSAVDMTKSTSDLSMNGLKPDTNNDGNPLEAAPTPIICKNAIILNTAFIPDGFSPNGDGINDVFRIQGLKSTELNELIIFNRWGGVVYASPDYQNNWAGEANQGVVAIGSGQGLPDGTYFYSFTRYAKGANGEKGDKVAPERIKSITLIR